MADVWFCKDGPSPARGYPQYEVSVEECASALGLVNGDYFGDLDGPSPKFNVDSQFGEIADYRHVVVKVTEDEGRAALPAGFYILQLKPYEVIERLGREPAPAMREVR